MTSRLAHQIDDLLPQTQCTKCGFAGCMPYAEALASGAAELNQCPPGGEEGIARLARLLGKPTLPLNPENGVERPRPRAVIDETVCIGCTLCIQACPVDAIVGAAKSLHTVIEEDCTGCDLCVAPCPVDCITMEPVTGDSTGWQAWSHAQADLARHHYTRKLTRLQREQDAADARAQRRSTDVVGSPQMVSPSGTNQVTPATGDADADINTVVAGAAVSIAGVPIPQPAPLSSATASDADSERAKKQAIIKAAIERARLRRQTP